MMKIKDKQRAYKEHSDSSLVPAKPTESRGRQYAQSTHHGTQLNSQW